MDDRVEMLEKSFERGKEWGAKAPLFPLILNYEMCETTDNINRNIRRTLESDYQTFNSLLSYPHGREISIVGFGPSLKRTWKQLSGEILACNGAHDWLIERGVIPKFGMFFDATPVLTEFIHPHPDVTYLIASRCHRNVFEALEGYKVHVWHAGGDPDIEELLCEYRRMEPILGGGTAGVTRSMVVVTPMGYGNLKIYGADSSFDGAFTHVNKSIVPEKHVSVWCGGKEFNSTSWLCGQVEDFKLLAPLMREQGVQFEIYGDGLLPFVAKMNGFTVHNSTVEETNG